MKLVGEQVYYHEEQIGIMYSERRLLVAVLDRAIRDCLGPRPTDAWDWLAIGLPYQPVPRPACWSFQWVCAYLDLDDKRIHRELNAILSSKPKCRRLKKMSSCRKVHNGCSIKHKRSRRLVKLVA